MNGIVRLQFVSAILGMADTAYLAFEHLQGQVPSCTIGTACEKVLTSQYAEVFGIPLALAGFAYYLTLALAAVFFLKRPALLSLLLLGALPFLGFLFSLWLLWLQAFVIGAYCVYCLISLALSFCLFLLGLLLLRSVGYHKGIWKRFLAK